MKLAGGEQIDKTVEAYKKHLDEYRRAWEKRPYRPPLLLRECLQWLPRGAAVLDLGCGLGQDTRYLQRLNYRAVGLDLTWPLLCVARQRSRSLPLVQADMRLLPLRRNSFDAIWAAASLIHIPKSRIQPVLRTLQHLLKPSGLFAATFVHGRRSGYLRSGWIPGRYISRWRKAQLGRAVQQAGWEIIRLQTVVNRERKGRWLNLVARKMPRNTR